MNVIWKLSQLRVLLYTANTLITANQADWLYAKGIYIYISQERRAVLWDILTHSALQTKTPRQTHLQTVQIQIRWLVTSRLIWICTVCHSVIDLSLNPLFATVDVSKFSDERVHLRNSSVKGLRVLYYSVKGQLKHRSCYADTRSKLGILMLFLTWIYHKNVSKLVL